MGNVVDKFGVPTPSGRVSMKSPKPKYRFRILFFGFGSAGDGEYITMETNTCGSPHVTYEKTPVHSYNSVSNYKGKYTWSEIEVGMRDTIGNQQLKALLNQDRREFNHFTQESRTSAGQYKFDMWIQALDGSDSSNKGLYTGTLNTWVCQGCFLTDIDFGDWDYSSSDPQLISFTVQPDVCICLDENGKPLGDEVEGTGTPDTTVTITNGISDINAEALSDKNFFR